MSQELASQGLACGALTWIWITPAVTKPPYEKSSRRAALFSVQVAEPPSDRPSSTWTLAAVGGSTKRVPTLSTVADRVGAQMTMQTTSELQVSVAVPFPTQPSDAFDHVSGVVAAGRSPVVVPFVPTCAVYGSP